MAAPFSNVLWQNMGWFMSQHWKTLFLRGFVLKPTERAQILLKSGTRNFQNSPPFERSACFYVTTSGNFERFQYFNFETDFLENNNLFQKNWSTAFQLKALRLKTYHFHPKSFIISITKNILPVTTLFSRKFCFSLRTSYKEFI